MIATARLVSLGLRRKHVELEPAYNWGAASGAEHEQHLELQVSLRWRRKHLEL